MGGMAVIMSRTLVCDVCKNARRQVNTYRLALEGRDLKMYHLCKEHSVELDHLIHTTPGLPVPEKINAPRAKVYSMEEVQEKLRSVKRARK